MNRSALGLILIILGAAFLLDNLDFLYIPHFVFSWPMIFIAIGLVQLFSGKPKPAMIFILLGGFFLADRYFDIEMRLYWPVILILVGVVFLLRQKSVKSEESDDEVEDVSIFGGSEKKFTSKAFRGGKITAIFGGSEIDLRESTPTEDAGIDVFVMFGATELKVPANWQVNNKGTAIFGGITDEREGTPDSSGPKINLKGFVMFGGVDIKS